MATRFVYFTKQQDLEFKKILNQRVTEYFEKNQLSRHFNRSMVYKTIAMLTIYILPFLVILSNLFPFGINLIAYAIMGVGLAGVGMSVMHDGNHFSYAPNPRLNRWMGLTMNLLGGDAYNWKIKHNKLHHVFTNVYHKDEDIESRVILRFAFSSPLKKHHRYQHVYAWLFYSLMTLSLIVNDIPKRIRYHKNKITNLDSGRFRKSLAWLILNKALYLLAIIGLPLWITDMQWWQLISGFFLMHLIAGTIMSLVFQLAHVVEGPEQAIPNQEGKLGNSLIAHQLRATADFSQKNKWLSWYVGGLNFQIEHHLFPRICHIHYPHLTDIVKRTTREFNLPFYEFSSFWAAMAAHYRTLKRLGREQQPYNLSN